MNGVKNATTHDLDNIGRKEGEVKVIVQNIYTIEYLL